MSSLKDLIFGQKVLEEVNSPINGKIKVVRSLGLGTYIQVDNLTQSGGVVFDIWKATFKKIKKFTGDRVDDILILGLGGGSCVRLCRKTWPFAHLIGVDIDPIIVDLGKKYLGLEDVNLETVIDDAYGYIKKLVSNNRKLSLIIVDLYIGQEFPVIFESDEFLENVRLSLIEGGIAVFNRLYSGEKRVKAVKFGEKLCKKFFKVEYFYPQANIMFICQK